MGLRRSASFGAAVLVFGAVAAGAAAPPAGKGKGVFSLPANVRIPEWEWNAGDIEADKPFTHTFRLENDGPGALEALFLQIATPKPWAKGKPAGSFDPFIMPGGSGNVTAEVNETDQPPGPSLTTYVLLTNQKQKFLMRVFGMIRPYVQMRPEPTNLFFEATRGYEMERFYVLHAEGHPDFKVTSMETGLPLLWSAKPVEKATLVQTNYPQEPEVWARKGDVILRLYVSPEASIGDYRGQPVLLKTNIPGFGGYKFLAGAWVTELPEVLQKQEQDKARNGK